MVDYGLMVILIEVFGVDYFKACAFSYTFSVFVNYVLSMRYVFHGREDMSKAKEATIYFILSFIGLGLNQMIMWLAVDALGIFYGIAKLMSTFMVTWYNFISRKIFLE
jgi:putative flippase GtrA